MGKTKKDTIYYGIRIDKKTRDRINAAKLIPRDTYLGVINRLLDNQKK